MVGSILKKPTDKFDQDLSTGVVYKIIIVKTVKNLHRSNIQSTEIQNKRTQKSRPHVWQELSFGATLYEKQPRIWF